MYMFEEKPKRKWVFFFPSNSTACFGDNTGPVNGSEYSPSYSFRGGHLSPDSNDVSEATL